MEFEYDSGTQAALSIMIIVMLGGLFQFFKDKIFIPFTVLMFLFGVIVGGLTHAFPVIDKYIYILGITPKSIFFLFLPLLIFDGSAALKRSVFKNIVYQAILLAVPGILINSVIVALFFKFVFYTHWSWYSAILLGATLSATDPVAVVCLLKELNADLAVSTLTDGEAIMNDGTSIILFTLFFEAAATNEFMEPGEVVWRALLLLFGGLIFGYIWAQGVLFLLRRTNDAIVETMLSIGGSYVAFFIADNFLHTSPVITMGVIGLIVADSAGKRPLVVSHMYHNMWEGLVYIGNAVIFFLVGALITIEVANNTDSIEWWVLFVSYFLLMVIRVFMMGLLWPLLNIVAKREYRITKERFILLVYGSLRGGVGLALALIIYREHRIPNDVRNVILFVTSGVVVLTICVNGTTAFKVVSWLKLDEAPPQKQFSAKQTELLLQSTINESIRTIMMLPQNRNTDIVTLKEKTLFAFRDLDGISITEFDDEKVIKPLVLSAFRTQLWSLREAEMVSVEVFGLLIDLCDKSIDDGEFLDVDAVLHESEKVFNRNIYHYWLSFSDKLRDTCGYHETEEKDCPPHHPTFVSNKNSSPSVSPKRRPSVLLRSRFHVPEEECNEELGEAWRRIPTESKPVRSLESTMVNSFVSSIHGPVSRESPNREHGTDVLDNEEAACKRTTSNCKLSKRTSSKMMLSSGFKRNMSKLFRPDSRNDKTEELKMYKATEGDVYICEALVTYVSLVNCAKKALSSYSIKSHSLKEFNDEVNRMLYRGTATLSKFQYHHPSVVNAVVTKNAIQHVLSDVKKKVSILHTEKGLPRSMYVANTNKINELSYKASLIHFCDVSSTPRSIFSTSSICKGLSEEDIDQLFQCAVIGTIGPRKKIQMCGIAVLISGKVINRDFSRPYHYIPSDNFGVHAVLKQIDHDNYFTVEECVIAVIEEQLVAKFCRTHEKFLKQLWSIVGAHCAAEEISYFYPYNMMKCEDVRHICSQGNVIFNREDTMFDIPSKSICILLLGRDVDGIYDSSSTVLLPTPLKTTFAAYSALYMINDACVLFGSDIIPCCIPFIAESNRLMSRINASHTATTESIAENPMSASASSVMHVLMKYAGSYIAGTYHILSDEVIKSVVSEEMRVEILAEQRDLCLTIQTWMAQEVVGIFNPRRMDSILSEWERGTEARQKWVKIVLESPNIPENVKNLLRRIHRVQDIITEHEEKLFWEKLEFVHKTRFIDPTHSETRRKRRRLSSIHSERRCARSSDAGIGRCSSFNSTCRSELSEAEIDLNDPENFTTGNVIGNSMNCFSLSIFHEMGENNEDCWNEPFEMTHQAFFPKDMGDEGH